MHELVPSEQAVDEVPCDALVCSAFTADGGAELSDAARTLDTALDGYLTEYIAETGYRGKRSEVLVLPTFRRLPAKSIALVGLGARSEATPDTVRRAAAAAARRLSERRVLASTLHQEVNGATAASAEGFLLGTYRPHTYARDPKKPRLQRVELLAATPTDIARGSAYARATAIARDLVNEPASVLTPEVFAIRARDLADAKGLETKIFEEQELADMGFGGLLAVSRGSIAPPRLIQLRYSPDDPQGRVLLVGKGVTFDSGGLSLKDARGMETMKTDMGGGAAVVGAMTALRDLGLKQEVIALIPSTENMPSGSALRPGDVIHHYGGRTTEVLNTDAEGRLILGDALAYAGEFDPDVIVDVATLTGAMTVALGRGITGAFSTSDALWSEFEAAARTTGEAIWRMPLYDPYKRSLDSDVADARNIGARHGGAIVAALYLKEFVSPEIPWVHLDIAGPGRAESADDLTPKGGTGVAARTILAWLEGRQR